MGLFIERFKGTTALVESNHYSTRPTRNPMSRFHPVRVGLRIPRDHHESRHGNGRG